MQSEIDTHRARLENAVMKHSHPRILNGHSIRSVQEGERGAITYKITDASGELFTDKITESVDGCAAAELYVMHYRLGWHDGYEAGRAAAQDEIRRALGIDADE